MKTLPSTHGKSLRGGNNTVYTIIIQLSHSYIEKNQKQNISALCHPANGYLQVGKAISIIFRIVENRLLVCVKYSTVIHLPPGSYNFSARGLNFKFGPPFTATSNCIRTEKISCNFITDLLTVSN